MQKKRVSSTTVHSPNKENESPSRAGFFQKMKAAMSPSPVPVEKKKDGLSVSKQSPIQAPAPAPVVKWHSKGKGEWTPPPRPRTACYTRAYVRACCGRMCVRPSCSVLKAGRR